MSAMDVAREAWGGAMPDWIEVLATRCAMTSQAAVARELGRSSAMINQVLKNSYRASMARLEERVRGQYMDGRVSCPGMGEIGARECQDWRDKARTFAVGNPTRTRMYRACRACPRFHAAAEEETA